MQRLSTAYLPAIKSAKPNYNRANLKPGIVHLGIGAFHRAHQAVYTDTVMNTMGGDWGIIGCSLRSDAVKQQLQPQDGLYTVLERGSENTPRIIGSVLEVLVAPENPSAIIDAIALPSVKLVSLTITEKGYCHLPASGQLNLSHPDIQQDIAHINAPKSAPGFIVAGLYKRFLNKLEPVSILSCDNLPHNGAVTRAVVIGLAEQIDPALAAWIKNTISFPATMVDRIVPATTAADIESFSEQYGYVDAGLVVAEPFSQWVIEDDFCNLRPAWERAGALIVKDVAAYETMKLRLLNGSHSLLAYAGFLAGFATVYETMQDAQLLKLTEYFMRAAAASLQAPEHFDLAAYQAQLIQRFQNPGLQHRTAQIAMDGSQKIPQRWLNSLRDTQQIGANTDIFAFALATWLRYLQGVNENGASIPISDPLAADLSALSATFSGDYQALVG
ncbi:MAG TPA: mannitol dehydrogenase family protein, partial [Cellvibrionaceae bacterium]|nr:mannitol dehydrogenase family protein [Cellvibrionaceae bacterium]